MKTQVRFLKMLSAFLLLFSSVWSRGQTTIAFNGAEDSGSTMTATTNTFNASSTNNQYPSGQSIKSGSKSFQKANGTATFVSNSISVAGYSAKYLELWNASISSTSGNGIDPGDYLEVYVSQTNNFTSNPEIRIVATGSNVKWGMDGTGVISTIAGSQFTQTYANGGTLSGANAFSKIVINIPDSWNTVYVKIVAVNNAAGEIWSVDDISIKGTAVQNSAPVITTTAFSGTVNTVFSETVSATGNPTSFSISAGSSLPAGLSLDTASGIISGTPTTAGTFITNVTATNGIGSSSADITFTINKANQILSGFVDQTKYLSSPSFTLPLNTDNAGLPVTYTSSDASVATVSGNTVTVTGVGTTNITAIQAGNANYNAFSQQIVLTVANDPITYNGVGRFEKIISLSDLTDGLYLIADQNNTVKATNTITNGTAVTTSLNATNDAVIDPAASSVWYISGINGDYTIQNSSDSKYLEYAGSSTNLSLVDTVSSINQKWNITSPSGTYFSVANASGTSGTSRILKYNASLGAPGFKAYATTSQLPEVSLYKRVETTIWNGTSWSNGVPAGKDVIISANYSTASQPAFTAKNITIQNNSTLEITSGNTVNANNITIENGANLIERDGGALVLATNGTATVKKTGTTAADKYVFWASPVASQNLANIYGGSNMPAFITEYNTANNTFVTAPSANASIAGKGYSVKNPVANAAITFAGAPNTGNLTYTLNNSSFKYNLVGNPYPSDINLTQLYAGNSTNISSTMYFWDSTSTAQGNNPGYATVNTAGTGATWTAAPNSSILPAGNVAKVGQGFIVKSLGTDTVNGTPLTFTNAMRAGESATFFNKNTAAGNEGKFWLRLSSSYNTNNTIAVTYSALASDAYDAYDSKAMGLGTDALYSAVAGEKVVIQGKAAFHVYDVVALGTKHQNAGSFTIELIQKEGIFDNGQAIYLHDKELNTYTNLQNQNYTFSASAGEWSDRFEIVYITSLLATQEAQNAALEIYRDGEQFVIRNSKKMEHIEVFEMSGRKILDLTPNTTLATIKLDAKGIYIVKVKSSGKELVKKISK